MSVNISSYTRLFTITLGICLLATTCIQARDIKLKDALTHFILGGIYERNQQIEAAISEYKKALKLDSDNVTIRLALASAYLKKNQVSQAIEELKTAIKIAPDAVEPHAVLALLYFFQNNVAEAGKEYESALQNAVKLDPTNVTIYKSLGLLYLQQKNFPAAEKTFKTVTEIAPQDYEAFFYLAYIVDEQKNRALAIEYLKKVIELKPDYHPALNYLGYVYVEENQNLVEAEILIKKALSLDANNGAYIDSLGWLYFKQGKLTEAIRELERAAQLLEDPVIFEHLAEAYLKIEDFNKAKEKLEKALSLAPDKGSIKEKLELLNQKVK
ncbi:MAG: tetratricopeptide repeat protein [Candidatus Omnitrophica bacterium]|nr:tetratricopeptide repeat protein [Candidatus Omnitrophota bacterium]